MGFAVTTPSALEEYEQIEVVNGLGSSLFGPAQPSGMFNFVTKRPTDEMLHEIELGNEGSAVGTIHADLSDRLGANHWFGYRADIGLAVARATSLIANSGASWGAVALDARMSPSTVVEGNFSYYNLLQHVYPGWFTVL